MVKKPLRSCVSLPLPVRALLLAAWTVLGLSLHYGLMAQNQALRAEASFSPPSITVSNGTTYKVVLFGTQENPQGAIPSIPGLTISNNPQVFRTASFRNGTPSVKMEMSFQVKPLKQGTFILPSWDLKVGSKTLRVPEASLQVLAPSQEDLIRREREKQQREDLKQAAFIEFDAPRPFLFEGETIFATISLFLWDRLPVTRIEQAPVKIGDSFSMTELRQPNEKRNVRRNGKSYTVFSWPIGLTAAMAGDHDLSFKTSIRIRANNPRNSPFNSPFFNDPFFGFGREESLEILGQKQTIEVRALPMKGRPAGFQGAIGSFTSLSSIDVDRVSLGDPVRLTFELSGTGNFSAIPAPEISSDKQLKVGPPAFSFEGNQLTKHEGKQSFEYILTPLSAGLVEIPAIKFSYFDPLEQRFLSTRTSAHPLRVDPGENWNSANPQPVVEGEVSNEDAVPTVDLFQTESDPGEWFPALQRKTLLENTHFWLLQLIPLVGFCSLSLLGFRRKTAGIEKQRQKENALLRQMKDSVGFKDAPALLRAFRDLLRLRIASLRKHPNPSSLSSEEILSLLRLGNNSEEIIQEARELLRSCDDQEFAGNELARQPLESLYQTSHGLLKKLK